MCHMIRNSVAEAMSMRLESEDLTKVDRTARMEERSIIRGHELVIWFVSLNCSSTMEASLVGFLDRQSSMSKRRCD